MAYDYEPDTARGEFRPDPAAAETLRDTTAEVKRTAADLGRKAAHKAEQARSGTASGMDSAASTLHEGTERLSNVGHSTAEALESGADYVREHDLNSMVSDLMKVVRNNPGPALLSAAALGFLVGKALARD